MKTQSPLNDDTYQMETQISSSTSSSLSSTSMFQEDGDDVPLRLIHGGQIRDGSTRDLAILEHRSILAEHRAEFWEAYAKEILTLFEKRDCCNFLGQEHPAHRNEHKTLFANQFEGMASQMQELGEALKLLKQNQAAEHARVLHLEQELKRTEKVKNGYKKQVKSLTAELESSKLQTSSNASNNDKNAKDEIVSLQNKLTTMRLHMEGYKSQIDQERVEQNLIQGKLNDLQDRYKRREVALNRAQKRCRELDMYIKSLKGGPQHMTDLEPTCPSPTLSDCDKVIKFHVQPFGTHSTTAFQHTVYTSTQGDKLEAGIDAREAADRTLGMDMTPIADLPDAVMGQRPDVDTIQANEEIRTEVPGTETYEDLSLDQNINHACEDPSEQDAEPEAMHVAKEDTDENNCNWSRIFGDMELLHAEYVITMAEDTLYHCIEKIETMSKTIQSSKEELNNLNATCAYQYEQIYVYKNTCITLRAKISQLEDHVSKLQQSSNEYQVQMDHLVEQQRHTAAEESHALTSEIQHLSQEQARLLLKLHAVEIDLDKSRALCRQLVHRVHVLEESKDRVSSVEPKDTNHNGTDSGAPSPSNDSLHHHVQEPLLIQQGSIVSKLQHIAYGLRGLSSPSASLPAPMPDISSR